MKCYNAKCYIPSLGQKYINVWKKKKNNNYV